MFKNKMFWYYKDINFILMWGFNVIFIKMLKEFFEKVNKLILKIIWKIKGLVIILILLKKKIGGICFNR